MSSSEPLGSPARPHPSCYMHICCGWCPAVAQQYSPAAGRRNARSNGWRDGGTSFRNEAWPGVQRNLPIASMHSQRHQLKWLGGVSGSQVSSSQQDAGGEIKSFVGAVKRCRTSSTQRNAEMCKVLQTEEKRLRHEQACWQQTFTLQEFERSDKGLKH